MGDLIKIVGVQYAVNSNHVKGEDMTAQLHKSVAI